MSLILILLSLSAAIQINAANPPNAVGVPPEGLDPPWLDSRRQAQVAAAADYAVFCDFSFTDRQPASGIAFHHRIVDDSGRHYRPNHYDHGNGIALADVDGDGRTDLYFFNQTAPNGMWRNEGGGQFTDITEQG
ncbi:MAG: VCBS repeat-containing protein, partial [Gemmatimonadetes bacterium]|nr:VCBS repeat-containing protein [Gemmatimonadota bacterium]